VVTPVARFIQHHVAAGVRDEHWLEEQCLFLVGRMLRCQPGRQPAPMPAVADLPRPLQAEVQRRVGRAIDFMHEHMHRDIGLAQIAGAAHLSPFHFLRLFQRLQGRTPTAHLRMLRARRALALLESTGLDAGSIAQCVGLSRVALWRVLRETHGSGARKLRRGDTAGPTAAFLRAGDDSAA
jgi:transcriptional regulator GlxA family with amidase domain